jgi:hypothetical protein
MKHGIENNQELAHAGDDCEIGVFTVGSREARRSGPHSEITDGASQPSPAWAKIEAAAQSCI